ncbi:MAG: hypothetical protein Q9168_000551 [Polycauliona sp. 1 TL-2023]
MAPSEDLIDFDIIETHKENIQSLPGGRSAKALASTYAPLSLNSKYASPGDTRNLNDAIRAEYEEEILAIADSDDPLDIYDRYVKWTLNAYPSAQATPESQLRPLLERATKAFQTVAHYKNDPRYLKLWLNYIRFFSDAPRETFAYLARHGIGEGLALFYEEFAVWLESAGRWTQAEEVYKLGIEREARPTERLVRKFGEFQHRFENRPRDEGEPSSPALPTVRPALAAKVDPFALSTPRPADPQAPRSNGIAGSSTTRGGRQKLAIFSDADAPASDSKGPFGGATKGWDSIGSISERRKENTIEARPWTGETLKIGKKSNGPPKMMIFKDESTRDVPKPIQIEKSNLADQQQITNPKTGKIERVFVNLEAVYPNPDDPVEEFSFEELRARHRGWMNKDWGADRRRENVNQSRGQQSNGRPIVLEEIKSDNLTNEDNRQEPSSQDNAKQIVESLPVDDMTQGTRARKSRRTKVMEVKGETQTVKTNLASPTGPKLKRKNSAEPTMTLHTKAATDDILDIFNQPLRNMGPLANQPDSAGESEFEDDDHTSAGESTGTGAISGASEFGDDGTDARPVADPEEPAEASASPWSEFTASKHVPQVGDEAELGDDERTAGSDNGDFVILDDNDVREPLQELLVTPIETESMDSFERQRFVPIPPEDYEPPTRPYRDPSQVAQNRLPFMTPIVEKTESSMGALTIREEKDYFNSKTPSRQHGDGSKTCEEEEEDLLCSPFHEIINNARVDRGEERSTVKARLQDKASKPATVPPKQKPKGPVIRDTRCNPMDDSIRNTILDHLQPELSSYQGYYDHRPKIFGKAPELRKFIKALAKTSKSGSDRTTTSVSIPPTLLFPHSNNSKPYTIKRELGKGAFAPVYLAQRTPTEEDDESDERQQLSKSSSSNHSSSHYADLSAIKCEDPPTPWEFYIMSTIHSRLGTLSRASDSILLPYEMHLFADEGYLVEQYLDQGTLLDLVNTAKADSPSGVLDETIAMFFTIELLRTVESLHSIGILHGDLKADNCLVRLCHAEDWDSTYHRNGDHGWSSKGLSLIDVGRGIDMAQFHPETKFIADWKTTKVDCAEMREMRPWTYQIDYWGCAGVVHSLLFGKYIEDVAVEAPTVAKHGNDGEDDEEQKDQTIAIKNMQMEKRWRIKEPLKRYWQQELWGNLFELLLNPMRYADREEDGKMPVMKGLRACREGMEEWLEAEGGRKGLKSGLRRLEERIKERRK